MPKKQHTGEKKTFFVSPAGIVINGQLISAKKLKDGKLSTYFGKIGFYFQHEDVKVEISTETISLSRGSRVSVLSWSDSARVLNQRQAPFFHPDSGKSHKSRHPGCRQSMPTHPSTCEQVEVQKRFGPSSPVPGSGVPVFWSPWVSAPAWRLAYTGYSTGT